MPNNFSNKNLLELLNAREEEGKSIPRLKRVKEELGGNYSEIYAGIKKWQKDDSLPKMQMKDYLLISSLVPFEMEQLIKEMVAPVWPYISKEIENYRAEIEDRLKASEENLQDVIHENLALIQEKNRINEHCHHEMLEYGKRISSLVAAFKEQTEKGVLQRQELEKKIRELEAREAELLNKLRLYEKPPSSSEKSLSEM